MHQPIFHTGLRYHSSDMTETTSSTPCVLYQASPDLQTLVGCPDGGHYAGNTLARPLIFQWRLQAPTPESTFSLVTAKGPITDCDAPARDPSLADVH